MKYLFKYQTRREKRFLPLFVLFLYLLSCHHSIAQTILYKRIAIVTNGNRKSVNDDAHYLTFTSKGCYESDNNGFSNSNGFLSFTKNENNLHCFYGNGFYGLSHYYFSNDYSRLNINAGNTVYVYQRETSESTTAVKRKITPPKEESYNASSSANIIPSIPLITGGYTPGRSSSSSSNNKQRRTCPACKGSGKEMDQKIYQTNYTGKDNSRYCSICGRIMDAHTHRQPMCRTCKGRGYIE